ncbi:response regulator [Streptomyces sp. NBC_01012]|uniref:response regulator n=1 Tax=Streptomyces sp. NBC_01012 TaxID=2903717 RepID=UPI00386DD17F|nr:response regulator transcription factor [Streptomyces sp. NBC_01012]
MTIRVLLADDQALLRATFRILIDSDPGMTVVAEAADGQEAVELTRRHGPDVVLMDIRMPGTDGLAATTDICSRPELASTRVLILTTFENDQNVAEALRAGASGFLGKDVGADVLLTGIRTVAAGESLLSPTATRALITRFLAAPDDTPLAPPEGLAALTDREREVMALAAHGRSNIEIAEHLVVSPLTVRSHIQRAMSKIGARDRAQLVVVAYQSGLVQPRPYGAG